MDITGAAALIAGGGGGFGAATARRLHAAGARVVVSDLDEAKGKAVADELGDGALFVRTDVTDSDSVQRAIDAAAEFGPLRITVVAHGGGGGPRTLDKESRPAPQESFTKVVDIFLAATYNIDRLAAAAIAKAEPLAHGERGVIINTASVAAFDGQIGQADRKYGQREGRRSFHMTPFGMGKSAARTTCSRSESRWWSRFVTRSATESICWRTSCSAAAGSPAEVVSFNVF